MDWFIIGYVLTLCFIAFLIGKLIGDNTPMDLPPQQPLVVEKKKRGRPKGSKNKKK